MVRNLSIALGALALMGAAHAAAPTPAAAQRTITCQSYDGRSNHCSVDTRGGVRLVRQLSDAACVRGRSWGTDRQGIWVSRGCRAQFVVGVRDDRDRRDRDRDDWERRDRDRDRDDWNRSSRSIRQEAERTCRNAVRTRIRSARNGGTEVDYRGTDRRGNRVVSWRTSRSSGVCRLDRYNRLVDFTTRR